MRGPHSHIQSEIEITPNHHCGEDVSKPVFEPIWLIIGLKISSPQ